MNSSDTAARGSPAGKGKPPWRRYAIDIRNSLVSTAAAAMFTLSSGGAIAQTPGISAAQTSVALGLPVVPTTRVLAIGRVTPKSTPAATGVLLAQEVHDTVGLYLSGQIDQWFVRKDQASVVFLLNTTDAAQAKSMLDALPLGKAGLMTFDLIPLGPLSPLAVLGASTTP